MGSTQPARGEAERSTKQSRHAGYIPTFNIIPITGLQKTITWVRGTEEKVEGEERHLSPGAFTYLPAYRYIPRFNQYQHQI